MFPYHIVYISSSLLLHYQPTGAAGYFFTCTASQDDTQFDEFQGFTLRNLKVFHEPRNRGLVAGGDDHLTPSIQETKVYTVQCPD